MNSDLKVTRKVHPGEYGAVRELRRYGDRLLAVRYRTDGKGYYIKTAEIIVSERRERKVKTNKINRLDD